MGVLSLFSEGSKLVVVTDLDTANAGSVVSGRVYASFKEPPPPTARLMLEFYGSEATRCKWTETSESTSYNSETGQDETSTSSTTYTASEVHPILSLEWVLADLSKSGGCEPGSYEYPFSFRLPASLPSSLCETSGSATIGLAPRRCRVHYGLRTGLLTPEEAAAASDTHKSPTRSSAASNVASAVIKGAKAMVGIKDKKWSLMAESPLVVCAMVQKDVVPRPHLMGPSEKMIPRTCLAALFCCGRPGSVMMSVALADDQIGRGQTASLGLAVRNYSSREIRAVYLSIQEKVHWKAREKGKSGTNETWRDIAVGARRGSQLERADKLGKKGRPADLEGDKAEMRASMQAALAGGDPIMMQVQADARDSYKGANFKVPQKWNPTTAAPVELSPLPATHLTPGGRALGEMAPGDVFLYERDQSLLEAFHTPRRESAGALSMPVVDDAHASVPLDHGAVVWQDGALPFTAAFEVCLTRATLGTSAITLIECSPINASPDQCVWQGKNSYGTKLAGMLQYVGRADGASFELSGFYTKTSKPTKIIPLAGWCSNGGKVVLWLPGVMPAAHKTGVVPRVAAEYEPQVGAEGQLSFEQSESALLLQGTYKGKPNPWAITHRWITPISVGAMVQLASTLTGYADHAKWIQNAPTAPDALSCGQPQTIPMGRASRERVADELEKLTELYRQGMLNQREFEAAKQRALAPAPMGIVLALNA